VTPEPPDDDNGNGNEHLDQRFGIELPYTLHLWVRGVRPFLFNRMDIEAYDAEGGPASKRKPRARPSYESMVWRGEDKALAMPTQNLIGSVVGAAKYYKSPMSSSGSATPTLRAALVPTREYGTFGLADWDTVDFRHARYGDMKRTPKPTYRPRLETGWLYETEFAVVTPELYGPAKLLEIISRGGAVMGIGDGRTIGFGRYVIAHYEVADGLPW
jgi:hypothetical protein